MRFVPERGAFGVAGVAPFGSVWAGGRLPAQSIPGLGAGVLGSIATVVRPISSQRLALVAEHVFELQPKPDLIVQSRTLNFIRAGEGSALPAASTARTRNLNLPSSSRLYLRGESQSLKRLTA